MFAGPWVLPPVNRRKVQRAVARAILRAIYRDRTLKAPADWALQGIADRAQ